MFGIGFNGAKKSKRPVRGAIVAALDVGSSKVCCIIARLDEPGSFRVIGVGHQIATGIRAGTIIDMEAAETSIGAAVHAAEQMAGETIRDVVVNLSMGHPRSHSFNAQVPVSGQEVTDGDIRRALSHARTLQAGPDQTLVHTIPLGFSLDDSPGIRDPKGMYGNQLGAELHVVTAASGAIRTLQTCIARCHLNIESMVVSPFASGLSCLVEDEMEMGAACVDIGGGGTTISIFTEGNLVWTGAVPLGGRHVTSDIAHGLATSLVHAERLKVLHGSARGNPADEREMIEVPQVGEDERSGSVSMTRAFLVSIIQARMEEIFEEIRAAIDRSGYARRVGRRVVLTGGGCQLPNTRELAQLILDKQVRIARPTRIAGLNEAHGGPAFSTAAGLLLHAVRTPTDLMVTGHEVVFTTGLLGRVGLWLRENL